MHRCLFTPIVKGGGMSGVSLGTGVLEGPVWFTQSPRKDEKITAAAEMEPEIRSLGFYMKSWNIIPEKRDLEKK